MNAVLDHLNRCLTTTPLPDTQPADSSITGWRLPSTIPCNTTASALLRLRSDLCSLPLAVFLTFHIFYILVDSTHTHRRNRSKNKHGEDSSTMPFLQEMAEPALRQASWAQATPRELEHPQRSGRCVGARNVTATLPLG